MSPAVTRHATVALAIALAVAVVAGQVAAGRPWIGAALAMPLAIPLPGLVRGKRYTYAWATMLITAYIGLGLVETVASPAGRSWAIATLLLAFGSFLTMVLYLRVSRPTP